MKLFVLALGLGLLLCAGARADVQRFALIIGNNQGHERDVPLRYAESDAEKVYSVMRDLGGFDPLDMLLLKGADARTVRRALIGLNDRIRNGAASEALLFVYYSGHADFEALRIANERVELAELSQLVRGSAAKFRLMVLDACRSSELTRRKGGVIVAPFAVPPRQSLPGEGMAFLTASAATEDAQESDKLRGAFFTHALVSGLLGAADSDRDGTVALEEAYRYAYDATLRGTSRTLHGVQHPSFEYDLRGHGSLALTRPGAAAGTRGTLLLPRELAFLVVREPPGWAASAARAARIAHGRQLSRCHSLERWLCRVITRHRVHGLSGNQIRYFLDGVPLDFTLYALCRKLFALPPARFCGWRCERSHHGAVSSHQANIR